MKEIDKASNEYFMTKMTQEEFTERCGYKQKKPYSFNQIECREREDSFPNCFQCNTKFVSGYFLMMLGADFFCITCNESFSKKEVEMRCGALNTVETQ